MEFESTMSDENVLGLSSKDLRRAADIREKIEALRGELLDILGGASMPAKKERDAAS